MQNLPGSWLFAFFLLTFAAPAHAVPIKGRRELDLQLTLLHYSRASFAIDDSVPDEAKVKISTTQFGLLPTVALGYGRGITDHLLFHGRLGFGILNTTNEQFDVKAESRTMLFSLTPGLRYVASGDGTRFFLGGQVLFGLLKSGPGDDTDVKERLFGGGPLLGFHGFLNDYISLDPALEFMFVSRTQSSEMSERELGATGIQVGLTLALTGWVTKAETQRETASGYESAGYSGGYNAPSEGYGSPSAQPTKRDAISQQMPLTNFSLWLLARPVQRGDVLRVEVRRLMRQAAWEGCTIELTNQGATTISAKTKREVQQQGMGHNQEMLYTVLPYADLERWLNGEEPGVSLCGNQETLGPSNVAFGKLTLRQFHGMATRAGTFVEVEASTPAEAPVEQAPAEPADAAAPVESEATTPPTDSVAQ